MIMFNESLFLLSFDEMRNALIHDVTIFHIALIYVLMYVVYKALGRYIYFKPQEHASKINRTFVTLSLLVVSLQALNGFINYLPFLPQYRWLYVICLLILLLAPLSIIMDRLVWSYSYGDRRRRNWHYYYLPISNDYYRTSVSKSERDGNSIHTWEEEGVESTGDNIHSDALLNVLALVTFIIVGGQWAYESVANYGWFSFIFFVVICLPISGIFFDRAVFSWITYLERKKTIS